MVSYETVRLQGRGVFLGLPRFGSCDMQVIRRRFASLVLIDLVDRYDPQQSSEPVPQSRAEQDAVHQEMAHGSGEEAWAAHLQQGLRDRVSNRVSLQFDEPASGHHSLCYSISIRRMLAILVLMTCCAAQSSHTQQVRPSDLRPYVQWSPGLQTRAPWSRQAWWLSTFNSRGAWASLCSNQLPASAVAPHGQHTSQVHNSRASKPYVYLRALGRRRRCRH